MIDPRFAPGDARCNRLLHAQRRAWERYALRLTLADLEELERRAVKANASDKTANAFVFARDRDAVTVESVIKGVTLRYVYLIQERTLVTFLTRDLSAEFASYRRARDKGQETYRPAYHNGKKMRGRR